MPTTVLNVAAKQAMPGQSTVRRVAADYVPQIDRNVAGTERLVSLGLGLGLTVYGAAARRLNTAALLAGGYLLYRGLSGNCPVYQALNVGTEGPTGDAAVIPARAGVKVEHSVTIQRPANEIYRVWRNFPKLPDFMDHLREVRDLGNGKSHWVARGPLGMSVEWDAEIVEERANEFVSWKSLPGADVDTAGSVHLSPAPGGRGTVVRVVLKYDPPAGRVGAAVARLFGENPQRQIEADLARFKALLEAGEVATTAGQPSGRR